MRRPASGTGSAAEITELDVFLPRLGTRRLRQHFGDRERRQRRRRLERERGRRPSTLPARSVAVIVAIAAVDGGSDDSGTAASNVVCPQPNVRDASMPSAAITTVAAAASSVAKPHGGAWPRGVDRRVRQHGGHVVPRRRDLEVTEHAAAQIGPIGGGRARADHDLTAARRELGRRRGAVAGAAVARDRLGRRAGDLADAQPFPRPRRPRRRNARRPPRRFTGTSTARGDGSTSIAPATASTGDPTPTPESWSDRCPARTPSPASRAATATT